ncbi:hypothetical protein FHX49_000283 [Microbacterium endophyticum]|uniref:CDP-glycerol--glycerophosphate glycerophosphotransferase n=1 Tax=Microbacterium endophyticum TaxID=1526412 RepID=A0A7W4V0T9_9MICO|nr:CDP-glycerol glycerophosphotransferase family protein [Microbacterium endophyticum]MBB2974742.1 hypothetical protein [Microbacterium endophyticum]NIK37039.1 hypothetical protein [Microbacterium endophyticum]
MQLASDIRKTVAFIGRALENRAAAREVRHADRARGPHAVGQYEVAVYFADGAVNMYQMRQWYRPLQELSKTRSVVILSRVASGARALMRESGLPVVYVPSVRNLESAIAKQNIRIVLYVNQNTRNFQMFRYGHRWHVFINHGESDKMYMTTNQFKAYDYAFVAGDAARERLSRVLWNYDIDTRTIEIGRPQADHYSGRLPYTPDERRVILYAPTWEGDRPSAHYGSLSTHGEALVAALLQTGRHRLIYRPHPRSGVVSAEYGAAHRRIVAMITAANARDTSAHHFYDHGPDLGWQLAAADVAVVDISAMVYDRLASGKALLVTRPVDPAAAIDEHGYLSDCEWLDAAHAASIIAETDRILADPRATERLDHWVRHYFGDTTPGSATARFHSAIEYLMNEAERWAGESPDSEDDPFDEDSAELDG